MFSVKLSVSFTLYTKLKLSEDSYFVIYYYSSWKKAAVAQRSARPV